MEISISFFKDKTDGEKAVMLRLLAFRVLIIMVLVGSILPAFEIHKVAGADGYYYIGTGFTVNHSCTDITQIPEQAILDAKTNLHIGYGHESHGAQITAGMTGLVEFANNRGRGLELDDNIFAWNNGGTDGALDLEEGNNGWLQGTAGTTNDYLFDNGDMSASFVNETREYLGPPGNRNPEHADVNVIIWAWCNELDNIQGTDNVTTFYLEPMSDLETEYPDVTFVYMTSRTNHESPSEYALTKTGNDIIRAYCLAKDKILYDFYDIESWDPVWDPGYQHYEFANDNCDYYDSADDETPNGNWALSWQGSHTQNVDWYECDPPHTQSLNGNLKAYAAWWLWAKLAGDGNPEGDVISITISEDAGTPGIDFGSLSPGAPVSLDKDASEAVPSITITVEPETTVSVDLQIIGADFSPGFTIDNAKYSLTYDGAKIPLSTTYTTFTLNIAPEGIAPGENATLWHWLTVPSGVTAGTYHSNFSYKAITHQ